VDKKWTFKTWTLASYIDIQNVTNRGNVEATSYNHDFTQQALVTGLPIFPSVGMRAEY